MTTEPTPPPLSPAERDALTAQLLAHSEPLPLATIVNGCYACAAFGLVFGLIAGVVLLALAVPVMVAGGAVTGGALLGFACSVRGNVRRLRALNRERVGFAASLAQSLETGERLDAVAPVLAGCEGDCLQA